MINFRLLRADEIDARVARASKKGVSLLLYKDARCDQNILDETVGPFNWQRTHSRDNANCTVSIWDPEKCQWIGKEDTGTESYMEREKGLASDSFKRACFNWGIGRELYTAPDIFIYAKDLDSLREDGNRWVCYDRFEVKSIEYDGRKITKVEIRNLNNGGVFPFGVTAADAAKVEEIRDKRIGEVKAQALRILMAQNDMSEAGVMAKCGITDLADMTEEVHAYIVRKLSEADGKDKTGV